MKLLAAPFAGATHKGWFWFCPVYMDLRDKEEIVIEARAAWLEPLFCIAEYLETARLLIGTAVNPDYPEVFMFKVTGKIKADEVEA